MNRRSEEEAYYAKHYGRLVGKTVAKVVYDDGKGYACDGAFWGLLFTDGTIAWIQCDPEGNGPGHLEIELQKKLATK